MTTDTNQTTETPTTVTVGNTVTLHYEGTLNDESVFDSSFARGEPITITTGEGQLLPEFEGALIGMATGEEKTFTIESANAYGERDPNATANLERDIFPEDMDLSEGMTIPLMNSETNQTLMATITEVTDNGITADFNHPLAGNDLKFTVEILTVE